MLELPFSEIERASIYAIMERGNGPDTRSVWGGSVSVLLAQDDLWNALHLDEIAEKPDLKTDSLSTEMKVFEVPEASLTVLKSILSVGGQPRVMARINAAVLRRLPTTVPVPGKGPLARATQ
jgi:hypothetical protein